MLYNFQQLGGMLLITLVDLFFIFSFLNLFIAIYIVYTFFQFKFTHSAQGSKLHIKLKRGDDY